jgi:hypothetical protein
MSMRVAESVPAVTNEFYEEINRQRRRLGAGLGGSLQLAADSSGSSSQEASAGSKEPPAQGGGAHPLTDFKPQEMHHRQQPEAYAKDDDLPMAKIVAIAVASAIAAVCVCAVIILAIYCCVKLNKSKKAASPVEYYPYGSMEQYGGGYTVDKPPSADRKLAHSAQMFHYQHQKQQMLELEKAKEVAAAKSDSGGSSEDENADDQYTVYECPGLADTTDLEVRNPLYSESPMPPYPPTTSPPLTNGSITTVPLVLGVVQRASAASPQPLPSGAGAAQPAHGAAAAQPAPVGNGNDSPPPYTSLHSPT